MKKHLNDRQHPIGIMCATFRHEFANVYEKYCKPKTNSLGVVDKVTVLTAFAARTSSLQQNFQSQTTLRE